MRLTMTCLCLLISAGLLSTTLLAEEVSKPKFDPTSMYPKQTIEGWTVYVHEALLEDQKQLGRKTIRLLRFKLYEIKRMVPEAACKKLQEIPIWIELNHPRHPCACYHPSKDWLIQNDFNPEKARCFEIANARNFLDWIKVQPNMVLHELAHGYHDRFLPKGYANPDLTKEYERMKADGIYESVLHYRGKEVRAYGLNNPMEYFAESTEAYFGTNDFYPFVRAELTKHDPKMVEALKRIWGEE